MGEVLRLALPKGRQQDPVLHLLAEAGFAMTVSERSYRPASPAPDLAVKLLRTQNIAKLVEMGAHDAGFAGHDWIRESSADIVELLDTGIFPVRVVAAAPPDVSVAPGRRLIVASEYENLTREWARSRSIDLVFVRSYGATEVFPPEDADLIVDISASGETLSQNNLRIVDVLVESSTRFVANRRSLEHPELGPRLRQLAILMESVLAARERVLLEMNVDADKLDGLVQILPAMKSPTVQPLYGGARYAVKVAVRRSEVASLVPRIQRAGATDILEYALEKVIP